MRVLVVEDHIKIAQALKKGLEQEHFAVDMVHTGTEGFAFAKTEPYDVIILDRMLPEMDGLTVCKKLRESEITTPILMLTAKTQVSDKVDGLHGGADDYLTKPFAFEELVARVRALLRRPHQSQLPTITIGQLTLNSNALTILKSGKPLALSAKEFALLEYLMKNPNKPISKETLIEHVWNWDADVLPNTVEVYIGYVRTKIGDKKGKIIQTVRGFGYKITDSNV